MSSWDDDNGGDPRRSRALEEKEAREWRAYDAIKTDEYAAIQRVAEQYQEEAGKLTHDLARVTAERDAMREDAERYRWLREQDPGRARNSSDGEWGRAWIHVKGVRVDCMNGDTFVVADYCTREGLDAAIDAARKEKP